MRMLGIVLLIGIACFCAGRLTRGALEIRRVVDKNYTLPVVDFADPSPPLEIIPKLSTSRIFIASNDESGRS